MNSFSKLFTLLSLCIWMAVVFISCNQAEDDASPYDSSLINQHMETEVTFEERYRPQFHYTPKINWMNDPNGLVYHDGTFHLFHQYNPFGNKWGFMSWNHATSTNLVHWQHQPVAIPYGEEEEEAIYSGSAVVDHNNTTGFGDGTTAPIVAIYTSAYEGDQPNQAQSLAYSLDGGETFIKYEGNPVLDHPNPDFRDPNVRWMEDMQKWLMVVALPVQHKISFYASDNLIDWEHLSDFGPLGGVDGIWECPDFFQLPVDSDPENKRWVLHVDMNPGAIAGGSGSQYFIGDWDGTRFTPDETISGGDVLWTDFGTDFYAAISWNNVPDEDGRRIWLGWMNNWDYANEIPTDPWRSAMSIPRTLHLETVNEQVQLVQKPIEELQNLREEYIQLQNITVGAGDIQSLTGQGISGKAFEMIVDIDPGDAEAVGLMVRAGPGEETLVGYDALNGTSFVDRRNSGEMAFYEGFGSRNDAPVTLREDGTLRIHLFVDWSSVEVFTNNGASVMTNRIFPDPENEEIRLFAEDGQATIENLEFWRLRSIWNE